MEIITTDSRLENLREELKRVNNTAAALMQEKHSLETRIEVARDLIGAYANTNRVQAKLLEDERKENARLRERLDKIEAGVREQWERRCDACGGVKPGHTPDAACSCATPVVLDRAKGDGVCPACYTDRPEEKDWRGGVCDECFKNGKTVQPS